MAILTYPSITKITTHENIHEIPVDMRNVVTIILGGGQGTRLYPLTQTRCKPAINFGGKYRLIDIPISNSINSDCHKIFIVTQFLSSSLHRHIFQTYHLDSFSSGFIDVLAAEEKPMQTGWYQGTADAVRQNLNYIVETPADYFLILSGDQLYNLNFQKMVKFINQVDADVLIASLPVDANDAKRMGILKIDKNQRVIDFQEKPQEKHILENLRSPDEVFAQSNISLTEERRYLGSMGIYLFKRRALINFLEQDKRDDFGKHIIPTIVKSGKAAAYLYNGYWEDIGTIETFYKANISLTKARPDFDCYDETNPIFANRQNLPPPKIGDTKIDHSIICEGSVVEAAEVTNSILGPRSVIQKGTIIHDSYLMGNEFYRSPTSENYQIPTKLSIGENCIIRQSIIDKDVRLGKGVKLINKNKLNHYDGENICIRDGIIIVTRGANLPDGFTL